MSEILLMNTSMDGNPYHTTEHYLRRVLTGNVASVRSRLVVALERLGYVVVDDEAHIIRGRRGATGWAPSYASADVLDYPRTLIVKLKATGEHATLVTYDYAVKHPSLSNGEKDILTRGAEAISSLATVRPNEKLCTACGLEATDDSRFCRSCGTPMAVKNSELEILKMSAEIRAGHTSVVTGTIMSLSSTVLMILILAFVAFSGLALSKGIWTVLIAAAVINAVTALITGFGWNRINRSLKRPSTPEALSFEQKPLYFQPPQASALPISIPHSVTDGTTELLAYDDSPAAQNVRSERETLS